MRLLGWHCFDRGQQAKAEQWFRRAIDHGDTWAIVGLARVLQESGGLAEAERLLREGADHGEVSAMVSLGFYLHSQAQLDEAESWYRRAADLGDSTALANLGFLLEARGDLTAAESWNRQGAALGQPGAMVNLAGLLKRRGQRDEALGWFRRAADRAIDLISTHPGFYRPWPGEAMDGGVSEAILELAETLLEHDALDEAESWLRQIADRGDARATAHLAAISRDRGDTAAATTWHKKAAEQAQDNLAQNKLSLQMAYGATAVQRHIDIILNYADDLAAQGDADAADQWRRRASDHIPSDSPQGLDHLDNQKATGQTDLPS